VNEEKKRGSPLQEKKTGRISTKRKCPDQKRPEGE